MDASQRQVTAARSDCWLDERPTLVGERPSPTRPRSANSRRRRPASKRSILASAISDLERLRQRAGQAISKTSTSRSQLLFVAALPTRRRAEPNGRALVRTAALTQVTARTAGKEGEGDDAHRESGASATGSSSAAESRSSSRRSSARAGEARRGALRGVSVAGARRTTPSLPAERGATCRRGGDFSSRRTTRHDSHRQHQVRHAREVTERARRWSDPAGGARGLPRRAARPAPARRARRRRHRGRAEGRAPSIASHGRHRAARRRRATPLRSELSGPRRAQQELERAAGLPERRSSSCCSSRSPMAGMPGGALSAEVSTPAPHPRRGGRSHRGACRPRSSPILDSNAARDAGDAVRLLAVERRGADRATRASLLSPTRSSSISPSLRHDPGASRSKRSSARQEFDGILSSRRASGPATTSEFVRRLRAAGR